MDVESDDNVYVPQVKIGVIPQIGQEFQTPDDARSFYNQYAREAGFSIRMANSKKKKETNDYIWKLFVCSKEGKTDESYQMGRKDAVSRAEKRNRGHTRCECKARLSIVKQQTGDEWVVRKFVEEHNHALTTPSRTHLLRSHRRVSSTKKALVQQFSEANIPTCQQVRLMEIDAGGPSSLGFGERDIRNHQRNMRQEMSGHDAETMIEHFVFEKEKSPNFFFDYETGKDNKFVRCFWADCESRTSYACFGDVVVFDTTYNTNKYAMVFAPFVGVNHHGQTIIFGCGLLSDETTESFVWLFSKFLEAMPGHSAPGVMITDQDAAISRAISIVFSETLHRFCLWHILNKFSEKMNVMLYNDQYHMLVDIIKQSESPAEFENRWTEAMQTTELGSNEWLRSMYEIRARWVPAYVKHVFAAGMTSSQRSESGHSFLKKYVDRKNSLTEFITRFNRALAHQRHDELISNHVDLTERPRLTSSFMMEHQMSQIYTKKIFLLFQKEVDQSNYYTCSKKSSSDDEKIYSVQRFEVGKTFDRQRQVTYFTTSDYISCSCRMFEFDGYPCRHMISYMKKKQLLLLHDKYILRRWTKAAKSAISFGSMTGLCVDNDPGQSILARHGMLSHVASKIIDDASLTDARSTFLLGEFQSLHIHVKDIDKGSDVGMSRNRSKSREETQVVCDPNPVRAKGCGKRLKSGKEIALSQLNRRCSACRTNGHDKRTCPMVQNRLDNTYRPQYSHDMPSQHYSQDAYNQQYSHATHDQQYSYEATHTQYPYDAPGNMYTSNGSSNFHAAPGLLNNEDSFS